MRLTAATIRTLTLPGGVRDKVFFDEDIPGFGLRLRASGVKTWLVQYAIGGRTRRLSLGSPGTLDPGKAREIAKDMLAQIRLGRDPAREKQRERAQAADTVGALLPRFLERQRARIKPRSLVETIRHLEKHARPLHAIPIAKLDRRAIAIRLSEINATHGPSAANRVRTSVSAFCSWAAREGYIDSNPCTFTNKAIEGGPRKRLLNDEELAAIWNSLPDDQYGTILKLLLLLGLRRDEIASLRWSEVDLVRGFVTLPPDRTKNRREHVVPLPEPALALLAAQARRNEPDGTPRDLIFGSRATRGFCNWHKAKLALDQRIASMRGRSLDHWTPHDFRRVVSTTMHERLGVPPHIVEVILNHVNGHKAGVAAVYNRATYENEKRIALNRWAEYLLAVVEGCERTVVPLRA
jgi:integrase